MKTWDEVYEELPVEQKRIIRRFKKGVKGRAGLNGQQNQCPACGEFFSTNASFDKHRTGPFGKPGVPSKRRCFTLTEMVEKGFRKNYLFYWSSGGNNLHDKNTDPSLA
jgi:hypothetical protein